MGVLGFPYPKVELAMENFVCRHLQPFAGIRSTSIVLKMSYLLILMASVHVHQIILAVWLPVPLDTKRRTVKRYIRNVGQSICKQKHVKSICNYSNTVSVETAALTAH